MKFLASRGFLAAVCGVAFAALCWDSAVRLADAYPPYYLCIEDPVRHEGKPVWISAEPVLAVRSDHFVIDHEGDVIRILTPKPPPVGAMVMVYGTFRSIGLVEATTWQAESHYRFKRRTVFAVSFIVVVVGIFFFRRSFAWRDGAFHPRRGA
jgi:hypothetical protein